MFREQKARRPTYAIANLRAGYRLALGQQRTLDLFLGVFNITNRPVQRRYGF